MRSSAQAITALADTLYTYLKPSETAEEEKEYKKPSRHRIAFAKNFTASLALPGRIIKIKKPKDAKKTPKTKPKKKATAPEPEIKQETKPEAKHAIKEEKKADKAPTSSTSSMLSYLLSFAPTCAKPSEPLFIMLDRKEECKPTLESQDSVIEKMKALETELKELEKQKELKETYKKLLEPTKKMKSDEKKRLTSGFDAALERYNAIRTKPLTSEIDALAKKIDAISLQKVELVADKIQEHAKRRVDLFFYLLIAVHNKNLMISKATTLKQHGVGTTDVGTNACHSSLFPQLKFTSLQQTPLLSRVFGEAPFTLKNTHFAETLNMTMELPKAVNDFDCRLESVPQANKIFVPTRYVKGCITLLNNVSQNKMSILDAMHEFFVIMNDFFVNFAAETETDKKIWEYEKAGTFMAANRDLTLKNSYLHTMLRLDPRVPAEAKEETYQTALVKLGLLQRPMSEVEKVLRNPEALSEFYKRIQNEILASKIPPIEKRKRQAAKTTAESKPKQQEEKKPAVATRKSARIR